MSQDKSKPAKGHDVELQDVDELAGELGIDAVVLAGVMELRGWRPGKAVSEKELKAAVREFLGGEAG